MNGLRLVLVTRRFWPLVGGGEAIMGRLATELTAQGCRVTLLTAQWDRSWPRRIEHQGVPVVRLPQPRARWLGTLVYLRALRSWLRRHRAEFDLVYVSMFKHDAYAALTPDRSWPVVVRAEGAGLSGDMHWQLDATLGRRIKQRCYSAEGFVGPSRAIEREIIAAGYARDRVHYLPNGVALPVAANAPARADAREALAEANPALRLPEGARLVIYTGRLHEAKGLSDLVAAWPRVIERVPQAHLWLVGEGPLRDTLRGQMADLNLTGRVVLAGAFDGVDEVLTAADAYVLPSHEEGMSLALLEAMAAGLPVVACDIPGNRALIDAGAEGLLVPVRQADALADAIVETLRDDGGAARRGEAARARVEREFSLRQTATRHRELFAQVIAQFQRKSS